MADINWTQVVASAGAATLTGIGGLLLGIWRWGRSSAEQEHAIEDDYDAKIDALREMIRTDMATFEKAATDRNDELAGQFREAFAGLRRQIDMHELHVEQRFLPRDDFRDFRKEYREDKGRMFEKLDHLLARQTTVGPG